MQTSNFYNIMPDGTVNRSILHRYRGMGRSGRKSKPITMRYRLTAKPAGGAQPGGLLQLLPGALL